MWVRLPLALFILKENYIETEELCTGVSLVLPEESAECLKNPRPDNFLSKGDKVKFIDGFETLGRFVSRSDAEKLLSGILEVLSAIEIECTPRTQYIEIRGLSFMFSNDQFKKVT